MAPLVMLDLCAGLGGASAAMRERPERWNVHRVEVNPAQEAETHADIRSWSWTGGPVDLLWASPPCTEFARESMPWCKTGIAPSLEIGKAVARIISEVRPRWWVVENVRGAQAWLFGLFGRPTMRIGSAYLWGRFPLMIGVATPAPHKERIGPSADRPALRSKIPYEISRALADACERDARLEVA